jgi:hypothetical protein
MQQMRQEEMTAIGGPLPATLWARGCLLALWLSLAVLVLAVSLYYLNRPGHADIDVLFAWAMILLGFPATLIWHALFSVAVGVVQHISGTVLPTTHLLLVLAWIGYVGLGYWQWFVLVPKCTRAFKGWLRPPAGRGSQPVVSSGETHLK